MKFFCNGREWDTDAPVYVLGYCIKNWFSVDTRRKDNLHSPKMFGVVCRKERISNLKIAHEAGRSWVEDFFVTSKDGYGHLNCCDHIFGKSPKEAKRLYEELFQKNLLQADIIEAVSGQGKGKYRFKT